MSSTIKGFVIFVMLVFGLSVIVAQDDVLEIEIGGTVEGAASTEVVEYRIGLKTGETVSITLVSDDFDTYLELYNDNGGLYASNDDSDGTNSQLEYTPSYDGIYMIRVRSFANPYPEGAYTLTVEKIELVDLLDERRLVYDEPVRVDANNAASVGFKFKANAGDVVDIIATDDIGSTRLLLLDADGTEIARDDNSGVSNQPAILRFELPDNGSYTVQVVDTIDRPLTGPIEVVLKPSQLLLVAEGPQAVTLGVDRLVDRIDLDGSAGVKYLITVVAPVEINGPLQIDALDPGEMYGDTSLSIDGTTQFSFVFQSARSGRSTIFFTVYSVGEVYELMVETEPLE